MVLLKYAIVLTCVFFVPGYICNCAFFLSSADFLLKINFFEKVFKKYHQRLKQVASSQDRRFVGRCLDPNCLQRLSVDGTRRYRVTSFFTHNLL